MITKFILGFLFLVNAQAQNNELIDNFKVWEKIGCFKKEQFDYPQKTNQALLHAVCMLVLQNPQWNYFAHSDGRPLSQHKIFNALDFHLSDYTSLEKFKRLKIFQQDIVLVEDYLNRYNLEDTVGFGIYPDQNNPFFHLDFRGKRARWGRINQTYVSIDNAKQWLQTQLEKSD